jgi:hypothetical protein
MSPEEESELLGRVMFEKLGFRIGDFVQAFRPRVDREWRRFDEPSGLRYVLGVADPPYCELFWVKHVRNGKPFGRKYREYGTRLRPLEGGPLVQMVFEDPQRRPQQDG